MNLTHFLPKVIILCLQQTSSKIINLTHTTDNFRVPLTSPGDSDLTHLLGLIDRIQAPTNTCRKGSHDHPGPSSLSLIGHCSSPVANDEPFLMTLFSNKFHTIPRPNIIILIFLGVWWSIVLLLELWWMLLRPIGLNERQISLYWHSRWFLVETAA